MKMSNPDAKKENLEAFNDPIKRWAYLIWNAHAEDQYQYQGIEDKLRQFAADILAPAESRNRELRDSLERASDRIWEHHEIGHIRRAHEQHGGPCELCGDGIFEKIEALVAQENSHD